MTRQNTSLSVIFAVILFFVSGWIFSQHGEWANNNVLGWLVNIGIILFILIQISIGFGLPAKGFLIDKTRRRISLSRLQLVTWTIIILSAYISINFTSFWTYFAEANCCTDIPKLQIIPESVLLLMGISSGIALVTPVVNQVKSSVTNRNDSRRKETDCEAGSTYEQVLRNIEELDKLTGITPPTTEAALKSAQKRIQKKKSGTNIGALYVNEKIEDAEFIDIFRGEEVKDFDLIDISKVQNFIFTVIAVSVYSFELFLALLSDSPKLPEVEGALLWIIGISHSYYVVNKAIVQSTPARGKKEMSQFMEGTI